MRKAALAGLLLVALITIATVSPAAAVTEPIDGTATTTGGDGTTTVDLVYSSTGILGSGTLDFEYVIIPGWPYLLTEGTGILTRSDGATLTGTEAGTIDITSNPYPISVRFTVTSGTGALGGATGEILLTGISLGPGAINDVFTMTGSLTIPQAMPTDKRSCKKGGWRNLADNQGNPFRNQGQCVSFVQHTT